MSQMEFGDLRDTLRDERERIKREREEGTHCLACGQYCKVYNRQIHSTIARTLIILAKRYGREYWHSGEIYKIDPRVRGDFNKTFDFGLIEPMPAEERRPDGNPSTGMWRVTEKGIDFVNLKTRIPRTAYIYDKKVLAFSSDQVNIVQALQKKFDYDELMGGRL